VTSLFEIAAREQEDDCFGLSFARAIDVRDVSVLAYLGVAGSRVRLCLDGSRLTPVHWQARQTFGTFALQLPICNRKPCIKSHCFREQHDQYDF
jgi:hypothetical protein